MDVLDVYARSKERVAGVRPTFECGLTPGCDGEMDLRHSTLTEAGAGAPEPYVDDVQLKCEGCLSTQKHGIGLTRGEYEAALEARDGERIVNFVTQWPADERDERLAALGYKEL